MLRASAHVAFDAVALGVAVVMMLRARRFVARRDFFIGVIAAVAIALGNSAVWHWLLEQPDADLAMASGIVALAAVSGARFERYLKAAVRTDQRGGDLSDDWRRGILFFCLGFSLFLLVQSTLT